LIERRVKNMLVVCGEPKTQNEIQDVIGNGDVQVRCASNDADALHAIKTAPIDCLVVGLDDSGSLGLLEQMNSDPSLRMSPAVVYAPEMTDEVGARIKQLSQHMVVAPVFSPERLLDQTALFLHRDVSKLPEAKRNILDTLR